MIVAGSSTPPGGSVFWGVSLGSACPRCLGLRLDAMARLLVDGGHVALVVSSAFASGDDVVGLVRTGLAADVTDAAVASNDSCGPLLLACA